MTVLVGCDFSFFPEIYTFGPTIIDPGVTDKEGLLATITALLTKSIAYCDDIQVSLDRKKFERYSI